MEADDVIHETYGVLAALDDVEGVEWPRAYAFRTARSVMVRHLRPARAIRISDIDVELAQAMAEPSQERRTSPASALHHMGELLARLPPECRKALRLRRAGLSRSEMAIRMAIAEGDVERLVARALLFLMSAMKSADGRVGDEVGDSPAVALQDSFSQVTDTPGMPPALAARKVACA